MTDIIRAADLTETLWANGAGRKADIASGEGWLLGYAWLDKDAAFSDYRGYDRTIALIEGPGFSLELPAGSKLSVTDKFRPAAFDGAGPMPCHVLGPCRVLNAISAYPGFSHTMRVMGGNDLKSVKPGLLTFAVVLRGALGLAGPLDTIRLTEPVEASAGALLAVVCFERDSDA